MQRNGIKCSKNKYLKSKVTLRPTARPQLVQQAIFLQISLDLKRAEIVHKTALSLTFEIQMLLLLILGSLKILATVFLASVI